MRFQHSAGAFVYKLVGKRVLFLLLIRPNGGYDLPKGHIEEGESDYEAARREIREETGLRPDFLPHFSMVTEYSFKERGHTAHKTVRFFIAKADPKQKVRISHEHASYKWLGYQEAASSLEYRDLLRILSAVSDYISRWERMDTLNTEYARLPKKAGAWSLSRRHVAGEGLLNAKVMLLGQAPGRNEDMMRRPFIGRSGKLLDNILGKSGIRREEAYITSVVQFFPEGNRMPTREEIKACKPFLLEQVEIIKPKFIVLLGNLASGSMLDISEVKTNHGRIIERNGATYMITFHPAAALRSTTTLKLMEKDFEKLGKLL